MKANQSTIIHVGIAIALLLMSTGIAAADDIHVYPGASIQNAVNNANSGDTIIVYPGTYTENIDVNKSLTILSQSGNPNDTIVQAASSTDYVFNVVKDNVTISSIKIKGATRYDKAGIYLDGVEGCIITNNILSYNSRGIFLESSSNNMLSNNTVNLNWGDGIALSYSCNNMLSNNIVSSNKDGIYLYNSENNTLIDNTIYSNENCGIDLHSSDNNILTSNTADKNNKGVRLSSSINNILRNNAMSKNKHNFEAYLMYEIDNDIDVSNTVDGKPIYYLVGVSNIVIDSTSNAGTIYCMNCQNISIKDQLLENNSFGIFLYNTTDSNIENNTVSNNYCGIYMRDSSNNILINNTAYLNEYGIRMLYSSHNLLRRNVMYKNTYNFEAGMINDIDITNIVDEKLIYYLVNGSNVAIDSSSNAGTVYCINCQNISIKDLNLKNNSFGIHFHNTTDSNIDNNTASNNFCSIWLNHSIENKLRNNNLLDSKCGVYLSFSSNNNTLINNTVNLNSWWGISLDSSSNNTIASNTVDLNDDGIELYSLSNNNKLINNKANSNDGYGINIHSSDSNVVSNNSANLNEDSGICLYSSNNNCIYNNYFKNEYNIAVHGTNIGNIWNITKTPGRNIVGGPYLGGNYWATPEGTGFSQTCNDTDRDGICDSPYMIDENNIDYLPLSGTIADFDPLIYDTNSNDMIEKDEVIDAIKDYFDDMITKDNVIEVIIEYFKYG